MKVIIIAFDALDHVLVEQYMMNGLKQDVCGTINLDAYFKGGGMLDCVTDEIFATFITGQVPDIHNWKHPINLKDSLQGKIKTIFDLTDSVAIDVPSWNRNWEHYLFQNRVGWYLGRETHREAIGMDYDEYWDKVQYEKDNLVCDLYKYHQKDKNARIKKAISVDCKPLSMIYFWFTDIQGHIHKKPSKDMYQYASDMLEVIKVMGGDDALYIVMSDHGMIEGHHRPEGFWSISKPLLRQGADISIIDWYSKIEKWLKL